VPSQIARRGSVARATSLVRAMPLRMPSYRGQCARWLSCLVAVLSVLAVCVDGYRQSSQSVWTDKNPGAWRDSGRGRLGGDGSSDVTRAARRKGDSKLLNQAVDAFRQASHLEKALRRSERAVSEQTKELRTELAKAKDTAATNGQSDYFKREERLDEALIRQADRETARDKRLVTQAEKEMRGDRRFLKNVYGISNLGQYLSDDGTGSRRCPDERCHQAKATGLSPARCKVPAGSNCPRISCYDYQSGKTCGDGTNQICERPSSRTAGCSVDGAATQQKWLRKSCPSMACSDAKALGYVPDFCTISPADGTCPQLQCFHYMFMGGCSAAGAPGSSVCMKPTEADFVCVGEQAAKRGGGARRARAPRSGTGQLLGWGGHVGAAAGTGMIAILLLMTCSAGCFFLYFKKYGGGLVSGKKPPPVPSYYGRL